MTRRQTAAVLLGLTGAIASGARAGHAQMSASMTKPELLTGKALVTALQKGGYVLYMRHPQTDPNQADTDTANLANIKAQRQLTPEGEAQAKAMGKAFAALKISFGTVLSSQYHRAAETARLAGFTGVQTSLDITEAQNVPPVEAKRRAAALRKLLATAPAPGTNTLLVAHRPNLQDAAGKEFGDLAEGEVAVFQPQEDQGYKLVARVPTPASWTEWASQYAGK
ncbi:histidine phosphatase family protein [Gloeobacter morelensis]|uniref:Histidine phosphatase family protein n=1 Tax=Gloeobacter morelensis MG652769 TaxID=2781736 RepID=A0ABY3PST1_9CYAN|nr:histidine phosphatase family protein [Gloeobacter morelensis]UFP96726.1 histidine phosphatase family protein [Gloeobacter morelensis MG652769]